MTDDSQIAEAANPSTTAGYAVYSPATLRWYDAVVLGLSNRFIWRCPTWRLLDLFDTHVTGNHLDVGVGTGYFLDRCRFPTESPRIVLMDANHHCLDTAAARIARYQPESIEANLFQPLPMDIGPLDSISLNYVLHCLPGNLREKCVVLDHLRPQLAPGGVLFGSTILSRGVPRSWLARQLMAAYNRKGIFGNSSDSLEILQQCLNERFECVEIDTIGCVALFVARAGKAPFIVAH